MAKRLKLGSVFGNDLRFGTFASLTLTRTDANSNPSPEFTLSGVINLTVGDVIRVNINGVDYDKTVTAQEVAESYVDLSIPHIANGTYDAYAQHRRSGAVVSQSATISITIADVTSPVLSSPVDTKTSDTTATGSVSTDTPAGTLYWVLSSSATSPSAAQVEAGQMHTGAAAAKSGSQAVTTVGTQNLSFTALTGSTAYYAHYMHKDVGGNRSSVSSADGFTTDPSNPFVYVANSVDNRTFDQPTSTHVVDIGTISGTKTLVIGVATYSTTISGVTVGGVSANVVVKSTNGLGSQCGLFRFDVASGGSKTIVITGSSNLADTVVGVGYLDGMANTPTATDFRNIAFNNSPIVMFDGSSGNGVGTQAVPTNGVLVGISFSEASSTAIVASGVTQHCDVNSGGGSGPKRFAMYSSSVDTDPSIAFSAFSGDGHAVAAWGP